LIETSEPAQPAQSKPLAVPTIDISGETNRHVIVAAGTKTDYRGQVNTVLMGDGKTMFAVWSIGHGGKCGPMKKSVDGGLTWEDYRKVCEVPNAVPCEPDLIRSPDGRQLACLMRENSRRLRSLVMFSDNEGGSWTKARELPASLTGDRHMSCHAPDGRLVVVFRDRAVGSQTYGHYVAWIGTYDDIRHGRPGQYRVKLLHSHAGPDCGYSGLERLPDATMVATTYIKYRPGPEKHSIVSVRFTLDETDAAFDRLNRLRRRPR
jgi:hypothetical protein